VAQRKAGEESISNTSIETAIINLNRDSVITENNKPMLTKIGRRVLKHKNKITVRIIKQNKGIIFIFSKGNLVWFLFNTKLYFSTEPKKIAYRILKYNRKISL
jgi:hypothetical protein